MSNLIEFTQEEKEIIKNQFFPPSTTIEEMKYCVGVAKALGLNPILKEIYFVERKSNVNGQWVTKIEPLAGKNAFIKLAHNSGKFAGLDVVTYLRESPIFKDGIWTTESDLMAKASVYRSDFDNAFIVEVAFSEYAQRKKDGELTKFWKEKPQTMLKKVAVSQALREAFVVSGLYDESEVMEEDNEYKMPKGSMLQKEKPKRIRRTKAQIEAEAKAEAEIQFKEEVVDVVEEDLPHPNGTLIPEEEIPV